MTIEPTLYIMVGLSASGKSTVAKQLAHLHNCVIVSSDGIREEFRVNDILPTYCTNENVFRIFHQRVKENLLTGNNVIADATNISIKSRRSLLEYLKNVPCYKIAYIVAKYYDLCIKDDKNRVTSVGEEVIRKQLCGFQIPFLEEGFDKIQLHRYERNDLVSFAELYAKMVHFDQRNPYHKLSLFEHCRNAAQQFIREEGYPLMGSMLHDIGKPLTQKIGEDGIAHYPSHANVGSHMVLCGLDTYVDYLLDVCFLINYHMLPMDWTEEKTKKKWENIFGTEKYNMLVKFHECDMANR